MLWPFWLAQLATSAKSFVDNPLIGSARLNAGGLHTARILIADRLATHRRRRLATLLDPEDRRQFDRNGFLVKRNALPANLFQSVYDEVSAYRGPAREMRQGGTVTRRIALDPANLARMPSVREALGLAAWRNPIRYAWSFNAAPVVYVQTILSSADTFVTDPQCHLHADTFHATVKAWLFLTDVAADAAPFTYVAGSHRPTPRRLAWNRAMSRHAARSTDKMTRRGSPRVTAAELADIGLPEPIALAVPANTLVVADTAGFHARGPSAAASCRVEIWAYGRRNPFLPFAGLDLWDNAAFGGRRGTLFWWFSDMLERMGIAQAVWRPREDAGAFDR